MVGVLLSRHDAWLETGPDPSEELFVADLTEEAILLEILVVNVVAYCVPQVHGKVVHKVFDAGEVRLVVVDKGLLDVEVKFIAEIILDTELVQIQELFLQLGLLGVIV